jgi:protein SCO1/2
VKVRAAVLLSTALAAFAGCGREPACCEDAGGAAAPLPGGSIYRLTHTWTDAGGEPVQLASLRGTPTVATLVFTHCAYACPRIAADLSELARRLPAKARVRFALFSMDPARDTPQRLREFARDRRLDPARFELYTADAAAVRELSAVLGLRYKQLENGDFAHSSSYVVLDADGVVAARVDGLGADPGPALRALQGLIGE